MSGISCIPEIKCIFIHKGVHQTLADHQVACLVYYKYKGTFNGVN